MDQLRKCLNDARINSIVAGAIGGVIGWFLAELTLGNPLESWRAIFSGLLCGMGIAAILGVSEGIVIASWSRARLGLLVGLALGAVGGSIGGALGQVMYRAMSASDAQGKPGSFMAPRFSEEVQRRINAAGGQAGEIEIALIWQNTNDLDLHVVDPNNEEIYFGHDRSASGGWLDIDRNASCTRNMTGQPIEHVRWLPERVPAGNFSVYVNHFSNCGNADPTGFSIEVKNGSEVKSFNGSISQGDGRQKICEFRSPPPAAEAVPQPPPQESRFLVILAVAIGWVIFGALVGLAKGSTRRSWQGARNACVGGAVGGLLGGLLLGILIVLAGDPHAVAGSHSGWFPRLLGFAILGACIGLWIVLIERALSAVLLVRSGRHEGREIYLDKPEMRLGRNEILEVFLGGDAGIAAHHATITREGGRHVLLAVGGPVSVNGSPVTRHPLASGDTIVVGSTRLLYRRRAVAPGAEPTAPQGDAPPSLPLAPSPKAPPPPPPRKKAATVEPQTPPTSNPLASGGTPKGPPPPPPRKSK